MILLLISIERHLLKNELKNKYNIIQNIKYYYPHRQTPS